MNEVIPILEHCPHMVIYTSMHAASVIPASVIERMISGDLPITEVDDWEEIVRAVLRQWYEGVSDE